MSQDPTDEGRQPNEEELRAAFEEQLKRISVEDVIVQTVVTLVNLAGRRLGLSGDPEERDLEQARQAIEATRALLPILPEEVAVQIRTPLSQLQMAFARESQAGAAPQGQQPAEGAEPPAEGAEPPAEGAESPGPGPAKQEGDAERAKARSKIWTPPGT